jgi:hypothetical protein
MISIDELVQPNGTGLLFDTSNELADQLEVIIIYNFTTIDIIIHIHIL